MLEPTGLKVTVLYDEIRDIIVYNSYDYRGGNNKSSLGKLKIDNSYFRLRLVRKEKKFPKSSKVKRPVQYSDPKLMILLRDGTERGISPELNPFLADTIMSVGVQEGGIVNAYFRFVPKSFPLDRTTEMKLICLDPEYLIPEKAVSSPELTSGPSKLGISDLVPGKTYYYRRKGELLVYLGRTVVPGFRYLTSDPETIKSIFNPRYNANYHYSREFRENWALGSDDILLFATIPTRGHGIMSVLTETDIHNSNLRFVSLDYPEKLVLNLQEIDLGVTLDIGKPGNLKDIIRKSVLKWWYDVVSDNRYSYWQDILSIKEIRDYLDIPESVSSKYFESIFKSFSSKVLPCTGFLDSIDLFGISEEQFNRFTGKTGSSEKA